MISPRVRPLSSSFGVLLAFPFPVLRFLLDPSSLWFLLVAVFFVSAAALLPSSFRRGLAAEFRVSQLGDRVFCFAVSSNLVGHFLYKSHCFACPQYKVFIHLWNNGGPNWQLEWRNFLVEEDSSWQPASKRPVLTGANAIPVRVSAFKRLEFPGKSASLRLESPVLGNSVLGSPPHTLHAVKRGHLHNLNFRKGSKDLSEDLHLITQTGICSRCLCPMRMREGFAGRPLNVMLALVGDMSKSIAQLKDPRAVTPLGLLAQLRGKSPSSSPTYLHLHLGQGQVAPLFLTPSRIGPLYIYVLVVKNLSLRWWTGVYPRNL